MQSYNPKKIEAKWQKYWAENQTFTAEDKSDKPKKYVLVEFPYPSGEGLHMGHLRPYVAGDVYSRYWRLRGCDVLYPMGWDAFGLPAENFAIKRGVHPRVSTAGNIANAKRQIQSWGLGFDWNREVNTTDPEYYKWTQWIFLQLYKAGLAYEATGLINWCPKDKTGLANEEVIDGKCDRCGEVVQKKELRQWYLKITAYAEKLLEGLGNLPEWTEAVKLQQANWIGKSTGAEIDFEVKEQDQFIKVFTTRPDTIFGATYLVVAPEHPLLTTLSDKISNWPEVSSYIEKARNEQEQQRVAEDKEKTGVELRGVTATNPATGKEIPIWTADYVLGNYGTGAIMAVPAHDERDYEFARKFELPIVQVVAPETGTKRENEERRDGGCAVVFDPKTQKYAVSKWEGDERLRLYAGGVEDNEDIVQGILREVTEESGLHDFGHVEIIDIAYPHFYNNRKKVNRVTQATCLLAILNSASTKETNQGEHEKFELAWMSPEEILKNWLGDNTEHDLDHWIRFIHQGVGRAIELGFDTTSDKNKYKSSAFVGDGLLVNSGEFNGQDAKEALPKIGEKFGKLAVKYKLRDWVFSRQRYWGEPIPLVHCSGDCGIVAVPDDQLPVVLPEVEKYEPTGTGESPLAGIDEWVNTTCPTCGKPAKRETNTMPQWAGSSWYYLRYTDPKNETEFAAPDLLKKWLPVDVYFGGMEHTTLHLLYSRFWHLALYDLKLVPVSEPYAKRVPHGIILASDGEKMSKSRGNVVNPDDIVSTDGADTLRMYELFLGPHEATVAWNDKGIVGVRRFYERIWKWVHEQSKKPAEKDSPTALRHLNQLIKKVGSDIEGFRFNTAVSSFMNFHNQIKEESVSLEFLKTFLTVLYPFAPHITEELHEILGGEGSVQNMPWPKYNEELLEDETWEIVVQVNGKVRDKFSVPANTAQTEIEQQAMALPKVITAMDGQTQKKIIFVPGKLLNIVI